MNRWPDEPVYAFDLETTGTDTATAVPVQVALWRVGDHCGLGDDGFTILVNPGCEIPEAASEIHGITTEAAQEGIPLEEAVSMLHGALNVVAASGRPLVVYNARYDITIMDRLFRQYGGQLPVLNVLDPFVCDRHLDKYRKGRRTLTAVCEHYGVPLVGAHDAQADATSSAHLMLALAEVFPTLAKKTPAALQPIQAQWFEEWKTGFNEYLARKSDKPDFVTGTWPL